MKYKLFAALICICFAFSSANKTLAQDTTVVQTLKFSDITKRRGWYQFPSDTGQYRKILMYYTLKCDAATTQDQYPCGEWDYTTYTNAYKYENINAPYYEFNGSADDTIGYHFDNMYNYYQSYQYNLVIDSTNYETFYTLGYGTDTIHEVFNLDQAYNGKSQFIWTASELTNAGLTAGTINKLSLDFLSINGGLNNLKIKLKNSTLTELTSNSYEKDGFTEVYNQNTIIASTGINQFNFSNPFNWDGTSNIVVEFCYTTAEQIYAAASGPGAGSPPPPCWPAPCVGNVAGETTAINAGIYSTKDDGYLTFYNPEYVDVPAAACAAIDSFITVDFWQYGDPNIQPNNEYIFEGRDVNNRRVVNAHLPWSNSQVYWDAGNSGTNNYDRINQAANFSDFAGKWNHWAFTKNVATGNMSIYLNGVLWHSGTSKTRTMAGITKFFIGGGTLQGGRYHGFINDFRIWNKDLDATTIADWMYKDVDASHPFYSNLQAYYKFDEFTGSNPIDASGNGHDATLVGIPGNRLTRGCDIYRNIGETMQRPNIVFVNGSYSSVLDSTLVLDSLLINPSSLLEYSQYIDTSMSGVQQNLVNQTNAYAEGYSYTYGPNGNVIDSTWFGATNYVYNEFNSITHQIQNYVTPYGIGIDLGPDGFRWVYEVTDYKPFLNGLLEISAGNQQELIDLKFVYISGTPPRDVVDFETIWLGDYQHSDIANDVVMPAVDVQLNPTASEYRVKTRTTGHWFGGFENCAEFCPKTHHLDINGNQEFNWLVWKECSTNPIIDQGGTWIYDRAGWCPGTFGQTFNHEITPFVTPGSLTSINYGMQTTAGGMEGNYRTTVQLVSYGAPNFTNDAAIEDVIAPNKWEFHNRFNPICGRPIVKIKNTGSDTLKTLTVSYMVDGGHVNTYNWTGSLAFLEEEEVTLDPMAPWNWSSGNGNNIFQVELSNPNGVQDEYADNDTYKVEFERPPFYNINDIVIWTQTNGAGAETEVYIKDASGAVIFSRTGMTNNTTYKDTIPVPNGCYTFEIVDTDEDGLSFFANSDGGGLVKILGVGLPSPLKQFNSNFGDKIIHHFTTDGYLSNSELDFDPQVNIFPNPSKGEFAVDVYGFNGSTTIEVFNTLGEKVMSKNVEVGAYYNERVNLTNQSNGVYFIRISNGDNQIVKQIIKE